MTNNDLTNCVTETDNSDKILDMRNAGVCVGIDVGCTQSKVVYTRDGTANFWIISNKSIGIDESVNLTDSVQRICTLTRERFGIIHRAAVAAPVMCSTEKIEAIKKAVIASGISDVEILSAAEAAVRAYKLPYRDNQNILVYDWGEKSLHVTILREESKQLKIIAYSENLALGGKNFTQALVEEMWDFIFDALDLDMTSEKDSGLPHNSFNENLEALQHGCEKLKNDLSQSTKGMLSLVLKDGSNQNKSFRCEYTRDEFEDCTSELRSQAKKTLEKALTQAKLKRGAIDFVILTGGTSKVPIIQETVQRYFGKKIYINQNPITVSAAGACSYAYSHSNLEAQYSKSGIQPLSDKVSVGPIAELRAREQERKRNAPNSIQSMEVKKRGTLTTSPNTPQSQASFAKKTPKEEPQKSLSATGSRYYINGKGGRVDEKVVVKNTPPKSEPQKTPSSTISRYYINGRGERIDETKGELKPAYETKSSNRDKKSYKKEASQGEAMAEYILREGGHHRNGFGNVFGKSSVRHNKAIESANKQKTSGDSSHLPLIIAGLMLTLLTVIILEFLWFYFPGKSNRNILTAAIIKVEETFFASDLSLNGISLGNDVESLSYFGRPDQVIDGDYVYNSVKVGTRYSQIVYLESMSDDVKTKRGIHPGSTGEDMINAYGSNFKSFKYKDLTLYEYTFGTETAVGILRFAVNKASKIEYISIRIP